MMRYWSPAMKERGGAGRRPAVGTLIALERSAWRVTGYEEILPGMWEDDERELWIRDGMPAQWDQAPFFLLVQPAEGEGQYSTRIPPRWWPTWDVLPEHYAVCVKCGELAPCTAHTQMLQAKEAMRRTEKELQLIPGCCPACNEPVTSRQKTITFPGEYVRNPLAPPDPVFHLRRKCLHGAKWYEDAWVRADPSRPRSLLTLSCEGRVVVHGDGSAECHGAEDCPSVHARHQSYSACFLQSHGCPRECPRSGHPGTRLAPLASWPRLAVE